MHSAFTIRFAGEWSSDEVMAHLVDSSLVQSGPLQSLVDTAWTAAFAVPGRTLFDGPMCRLESFDVAPAGVRIGMSRTSYKTFWGTNISHPELADQFGTSALANPIGVSPALETADGWLLLGRRNDRVAYYPGRLHPFAGCLEPSDAKDGTAPDVFVAVRRELAEELHLPHEAIGDVRLIGLAEDAALRQPELIFRVRTSMGRTAIESRLDGAEHDAVVGVRAEPTEIARILERSHDGLGLTPIAAASLLLWGRLAFGDDWAPRGLPAESR